MTDREPSSFLQRAAAYVIDLVAVGFIWFGRAFLAELDLRAKGATGAPLSIERVQS